MTDCIGYGFSPPAAACICAPGITAPLGSVTVPSMGSLAALSRQAARSSHSTKAHSIQLFLTWSKRDPAFRGSSSLLSQDQGIRSFLHVINDLCWVELENLGFDSWETELENRDDAEMIKALLKSLLKQGVADFIRQACEILAEFDWRAATAPGLSEEERKTKLVFRGSGGYTLAEAV